MVERVLGIILPVFLIIALGFAYARKAQPDMAWVNRINMNLLSPALIFTALASKEFDLAANQLLILGSIGALRAGLGELGAGEVWQSRHGLHTLPELGLFLGQSKKGLCDICRIDRADFRRGQPGLFEDFAQPDGRIAVAAAACGVDHGHGP